MSATKSELLGPGPAQGLAGILDATDVALGEGDALPLFWHWVYLLERPPSRELGPDGHPRVGLAAPPPGSRRMWAGGRVSAYRPLVLGRLAQRSSEVVDRRHREGRSGPLTFVTVRHQISQDGHVAVEEWQEIVYLAPVTSTRPDGAGPAPATPPAGLPAANSSSRPGPPDTDPDADPNRYSPPAPDTVTLFRLSALTYNSHRIHYDLEYVRGVEGYRDLVVHGPLQALYMAEAARRRAPAGTGGPTSASYRMTSPLLLGDGLRVEVKTRSDGADVTIATGAGVVTSSGSFGWQPAAPA